LKLAGTSKTKRVGEAPQRVRSTNPDAALRTSASWMDASARERVKCALAPET
jgi:hypothetical protein